MKNLKKLIPALCLLLISAMLLGTSTFAWFSMSRTVTATGMKVTAKADSGIVIRENITDAKFAAEAVVTMTAKEMAPTSTVDLTNWYKAESDKFEDAKAKQAADKYKTADDTHYLKNTFAIRSNTGTPVSNVNLKISSVTATTGSNSATLNKSIRVALKYGDKIYIYAPLAGEDVTLEPGYTTTAKQEAKAAAADTDIFTLTNSQVPADDVALLIDCYIWFEGEDANCKSSNVTATLDDVVVSLGFETVPVTPVTPAEEPTEST